MAGDGSKKAPTKKRAKAGTSRVSAAHRRKLFVEAYISNGGNATQAAISAGYSPHRADVTGAKMVGDIRISEELERRRAELEAKTELSTERVLREVARVALSDPRGLFRADGALKPPSEWTDEQAAAIASVEFDDAGKLKVRLWDKNAALEKAAKHLGLYERDNKQKTGAIADLLRDIAGSTSILDDG